MRLGTGTTALELGRPLSDDGTSLLFTLNTELDELVPVRKQKLDLEHTQLQYEFPM